MNENRGKKEHLCEYLSEDILEEDFMRIFANYLTALKVFGASRVDARDRFVSAPTGLQKCYTILLACAAFATFIVSSLYTEEQYEMKLIILASNFQAIVYFVIIIFHARFVSNEDNANLYIMMQRIDRIFCIHRHPFLTSVLRQINLMFLVFTFVLFFVKLIPACIGGVRTFLLFFRQAIFAFVCFLDISYSCNQILYFFTRLRFINSIILNHVNGKPEKTLLGFEFTMRQTMRQLVAESHDFRTCELDVYLKELLECFSIFCTLHQLPIALYIVNFFISILINTKYTILKFKINEIDAYVKYLVPIFTTSAVLQLFLLCVRFDIFFREVKEVRRSIVAVLSSQIEASPVREKAKRMWKLVEEFPSGFSVYGVWQIDAVFLIHFFNVSSTILFTMLQFAFL